MYPEKLENHLGGGLKPIYLLHGEEPLGMMEAADLIRLAASNAGCAEREVVVANEDSDWASLRNSVDSMSLFSSQRLIDLRIYSGKPGRVGSAMLKDIAESPPDADVLLITSGRLERSQMNSAWFKAIDKVGVTIAFWPPKAQELPAWINSRMASAGLTSTVEARKLLAERVEGNLLAARQEIERLSLLYPDEEIDEGKVLSAVSNSARYSIADVVDAAMRGDAGRAVRIIDGLNDEGVTPVLVLWALTQEIRSATHVAQALAAGRTPATAMKSAGIWGNREASLKLALSRHTERSWIAMLRQTSFADRVLKGQEPGDIQEQLRELGMRLATDGRALICTA